MAEQDSGCNSQVEVETPLGKAKINTKKMAEAIAVLSLAGTCVLGYAYYQHEVSSAKAASDTISVLKVMTEALRMNSCLISQPQENRQAEFSNRSGFCAQMSKLP